MNKSQVKDRTNKPKGKETVGKGRTVLGDINDDSEKHGGKDGAASRDANGDADSHGGKDQTVLGDLNDGSRKRSK